MVGNWTEVPTDRSIFTNVDEAVLSNASAAIENAFLNEAGGHTRFPGDVAFATIPGNRVYLHDWRENLIAATDEGRVYRVDQQGAIEDVTGVVLSGGRRPVFAATEDELLIAAGGPILRLARDKTQLLSPDAPESTHVGFVDGFVLAIEPYSGRFYHSNASRYRTWNPLDVMTAEGKPDDLNALIVSEYRELLLCGIDSIEQFERVPDADTPFFRRWSTGEGLAFPYTLVTSDNGTWGVNKDREFVRFAGQESQVMSDAIGRTLEAAGNAREPPVGAYNRSLTGIDNWKDAWADRIHIGGQKFLLLQIPYAINVYGTEGITFLFDYRRQRWTSLYGWDAVTGLPARWPAWSYRSKWGRHFIGVEGGIREIRAGRHATGGGIQRMLGRTGHIDRWGPSRVDNVRVRLRRGLDSPNRARPTRIMLRANRDNEGFGPWVLKTFGAHGQRNMVVDFQGFGRAETWQFEYQVTDDVPVDFVSMSAQVTRLPR